MKSINRIYLTICLLPFLFIIVISSLNFTNRHKISILTWKSPNLPIGYLTTISSTLGFVYGILTISSLNKSPVIYRKTVTVKSKVESNLNKVNHSYNEYQDNNDLSTFYENDQILERDPRDPSPTLTVPFRVKQSSLDNKENERFENNYEDFNFTQNKINNESKYSTSDSEINSNVDDWSKYKFLEDW